MASIFLARPARPRSFTFVWTPVLLGIFVIICESTATMSASNTSRWLRPFIQAIFGHLSDPTWEIVHHLIRKTGHFLGYGTLCVLFLRSWLYTLSRSLPNPGVFQPEIFQSDRHWRLRSWVRAILCTALVASADEFHQSFLPSRTGKFTDVLLDTCGACILSTLVLAAAHVLRRRTV